MSEVVHKVVDGIKHATEVVGDGAKQVADVTIVSRVCWRAGWLFLNSLPSGYIDRDERFGFFTVL